MGAVLLPLPRVSRSHHLADAEGIQLKKILSMKKVNINYLLVLVMWAVLLPLPRVSRSHHLAVAEGIQFVHTKILLVTCIVRQTAMIRAKKS